MGRLIDADALIAQMEADAEQLENVFAKMFYYGAINDVKHAPTVDAAPVRHGKWLEDPDDDWGYRCSECGHLELYQFDYCSSCGAKMDGKDGDADGV